MDKHLGCVLSKCATPSLCNDFGECDVAVIQRQMAAREASQECCSAPQTGGRMMPLSDINNLDEVCAELGIQESDTTPAEAVRELKAGIERLEGELALLKTAARTEDGVLFRDVAFEQAQTIATIRAETVAACIDEIEAYMFDGRAEIIAACRALTTGPKGGTSNG